MNYWLVMPAAGRARRFGSDTLPKQYAALRGRTVLEWALAPFLADPRCRGIVVAVAPTDERFARLQLPSRVRAVPGGAERSHSVRAALEALRAQADAQDWVLVHDGARPCLSGAELERLLGACAPHAVGGLLALPLADTLKVSATDAQGTQVVRTEARGGLWRALTPQMFRFAALCAALDAAHARGRSPGDESEAIEWSGGRPLLVEGAASNLKITLAGDLALAAALLAQREGG
ncbi:MAG: 2-C-methyl-D-erythritol 4-phosphate cytidylyltransferase [Gammaproteobacteria bacterium]|nr:2-C-methyl-D-erythritol 4-phosphate cytidylyltransferase [Gammaproteobacteria bacterium]